LRDQPGYAAFAVGLGSAVQVLPSGGRMSFLTLRG
jgi:hypothetical protein